MIDKAKPVSLHTKVDSLNEKKPSASEQKLKEVADLYEKQFMREMLKQMRATVSESGFIKTNQAEKIFREQMDDHYTDQWSVQGGIGFSQVIYDQLVEKFGAQLGIKKENDLGPVPAGALPLHKNLPLNINEQSLAKVQGRLIPDATASAATGTGLFQIDLGGIQGKLPEVQSPWAGTLIEKLDLGPDEHLLKIEHTNGLKSEIKFSGVVKAQKGENLEPGQVLGVLNPDQSQLFWGVRKNISE